MLLLGQLLSNFILIFSSFILLIIINSILSYQEYAIVINKKGPFKIVRIEIAMLGLLTSNITEDIN